MTDDARDPEAPAPTLDDARAALDALSLAEIEEVAGELQRRVGVAVRRMGEQRADQLDAEGRSARWRVAALATGIELAAATLGAVAASTDPPSARVDRHPATIAALMYAAPSLPALLGRLEQDRRLVTSLARSLESRLDEARATPWGFVALRHLLTEVTIAETARCAQHLEREVATASI